MKTIKRLLFYAILLVSGIAIALPYLVEGKLAELFKEKVNEQIDATLDFESVDFSLWKGFPDAHITINQLALVNKAPFEGDTLFKAEQIDLEMSLGVIFQGSSSDIGVKKLELEDALLNVVVDSTGRNNYDIAKSGGESATGTDGGSSGQVSFDLKEYHIKRSRVNYRDQESGTFLEVRDIRHNGWGDLGLAVSDLQTETEALVSFSYDSMAYLTDQRIALKAGIGINLNLNKYVFLKNEAQINQLPLVFDGFVQLNESHQLLDLNFRTPSSDFKNFLAVIPKRFSQDIEGVQTRGNFSVNGKVKGILNETNIPTFDIRIDADNASFKYPELDKSVNEVNIEAEILNTSGKAEETYLDLKQLAFNLDGDRFRMKALIENLTGNTAVDAEIKGKLNLSNLAKAYPMPSTYDLGGILVADISTKFSMSDVEAKRYENTKTQGTLNLLEFEYAGEELQNPLQVKLAAVEFTPKMVDLKYFDGKLGQTDFSATGRIDNLLGFFFNKESMEGRFQMNSEQFVVNDFMVDEAIESEDSPGSGPNSPELVQEKIKIPAILDCTIDAKAKKVLYDNLTLRNVSGQLRIKEETATISNLQGELLGGSIQVNGLVSTKEPLPEFSLGMKAQSLKVAEAFNSLTLFKVLAPVGEALDGKLQSEVRFEGNLKDNLSLDLGTMKGLLNSRITTTKINAEQAPLLAALDNGFAFIDFESLPVQDLKTELDFDNGQVKLKPFTLQYKDIPIEISGGHAFDQLLDYRIRMDVPVNYLGEDITRMLESMNDPELNALRIPIEGKITGYYSSPRLESDLQSATTNLGKRLIELQKDKLLNKGSKKAGNLLEGLLGGKKKDSTQQEDAVKDKAKSLLGSLLGKKKDTTAKKN